MVKKPTQTSTRWLIIVNSTLASLKRPWDTPPIHQSQQRVTNKKNPRTSFPTRIKLYSVSAYFHFLFLLIVLKFQGLRLFFPSAFLLEEVHTVWCSTTNIWATCTSEIIFYYFQTEEISNETKTDYTLLTFFCFENIFEKSTCISTH